MDTVSVSLEVLGGLLGKTTVELQSALMIDGNDGAKVPIDQSNIDKIVAENFRTRLAEQKDAGKDSNISYGKKSAFDDVEKYLTENHGIPKGTDWKTGFSNVVTQAKSQAQTTDEVVKASEPYKAMATKLQETEKTLHDTKKGFRDRLINDKFQSQIKEVLSDDTLGLALPDDTAIRSTQIKSFNQYLASIARVDLNDKDDLIPIDDNGKQLEDPNFNPLSLKALVINNAKSFWPTKNGQPNRTSPPAGVPPVNGEPVQGAHTWPKWTNAEEFSSFVDKAILDNKDVTFIKEATAAFESQSK